MISFNPKSWFGKIERKSSQISIAPGSFLDYALRGGSYISARQAADFYRNTAAVATAVDMIADSIEQIKPVIEDKDGKFIDDHEILDFLKRPNGFDVWHSFIGTLSRNYLLKHDTLMTSAGNVMRPPIEMWPVSLQVASVTQGIDDYPFNYIVPSGPIKGNFTRNEKNRKIGIRFYDGSLKEIYHISGFSSRITKTESDSPLQAASNEARQIVKGKSHNLKLLENGGRLSLLIAFNDEDSVGDDVHKDRIRKINEQWGGEENIGKIGVISNADISEIKELGTSNKDMDYANLESMASMAIYLRYKIPLPLVDNSASTFNNLSTGIELLYDNSVLPTVDVLFSGLTYFLFHRFGIDPSKQRITYNPEAIGPLKKRKLAEVEQRRKIAIETINELRSLLPGREPLKKGDILYQAANLVPVGEDLFTDDNNDT